MKIRNIIKKYSVEIIILIFVAVILIKTLFISPIIGKCDNGDFGRLIIYGKLSNLSNDYKKMYDKFVHMYYLISSPKIFLIFYKDWVSETILLKISILISLLAHGFSSNLFDIRYMAFVYSAIFILAMFLIMKFKRFSTLLKVVLGIYIIMIFTDTSYIAYFNSFFGEAGTIVFFFLNIGTYLNLISKEKPKIRDFIYFFIASCSFLTSKAQELPLLVFMLIVYAGLYFYYKENKQRKCIIISSILVITVCAASYLSLTNTMNRNNIYQSVFLGVLIDSKNPEKDLQELGLNKKFMVFYGQSFYNRHSGNDPLGKEMLTEFYPNVSPVKILCFYLRHPTRFWQKVVESANNAYAFSEPTKSNFLKGQYDPNKKVNTFRTRLVKRYINLYHNIYAYIFFSVAYFCIVIFYFKKNEDRSIRLLLLMLLFILLSGASQFVLPVIGSGHGDFGKHLFLLNLTYDAMIGVSILWCFNVVSKLLCKKLIKRRSMNL